MGRRPDRDAAQGRDGERHLAAGFSRRRFSLTFRGCLSQGARSSAWPSGGASRRTQAQRGACGGRRRGRTFRPAWACGLEGQHHHGSAACDYAGQPVASCRSAAAGLLRAASPARRRALMRPRHPLRLHRSAALALLTLAGCAYAAVRGGQVNLQRAEQIYSDVQELRQLNFKNEVPLVLMDQGQANFVMERELTRNRDEAELLRAAEVGEMTGLYAPRTNLRAQTMHVLSGQVVSFYDPQDREMILVKGRSQPSRWAAITGFFTHKSSKSDILVAHELTHALQDQYFGVHAALNRIADNDDRRLALKSVVEGDATLVGYGYVSGRVDAEAISTLLSNLGDMPKLFDVQSPATPVALRDSLIFQYTDGARFVGEVFRRGGWSAVNALYSNPPLSTRQVLDPTLYFIHSSPLAITVGGWAPALKGWR